MVASRTAARQLLARGAQGGVLVVAVAGLGQPACAHRHHPHRGRVMLAHAIGQGHGGRTTVHSRPGGYVPPFAAYAVDGNSGRVLYAKDENALRHPASVTKVMTLYLLFERLEHGQLSLDDRLDISEHAAAQAPTKLGLRPGSSIRIEDAIKSIVTKSANDMAVAIAERLGGDEASFAQMMTRKAHSLGMSRTNFVNASGLPDDMQLTTAHDLALLGRAIHDRYPRYFRFFSTPSFRYAGQVMQNHNHLMEQVEGMDGIKTGYTRSSGFNLLSSVSRNGHWLVSVVLGGRTRLGRDRVMADIISAQIDKCATQRTAPLIAENPLLEHVAEAIPVVTHEGDAAPPVEGVDEDAAETRAPRATAVTEDAPAGIEEARGGKPAGAEGEPEGAAEGIVSEAAPRRAAPGKASPVKLAQLNPRTASEPDMTATGSIHPARGRFAERVGGHVDGATSRYSGSSTATPTTAKRTAKHDAAPDPVARTGSGGGAGGWIVQIGATPTAAEAAALLGRAKTQSHGALATARPFTEKVQKGRQTLFRARFAGLEGDRAGSVCRSLKRAGVACIAMKN